MTPSCTSKNTQQSPQALAAELNGFPGPSHVLGLADKLDLTFDQRASINTLFDLMKAEAVAALPTQW